MSEQVWLAQLWAENMLGVLARSRTLYEEIAHLVGRSDLATTMAVLPLGYRQAVKNHVDAYLWAWGYLRPFATQAETVTFFQLLQERDRGLNLHLYRLVLRHELWYLYNSRLFLDDPCPDRLWTHYRGAMTLVTLGRSGHDVRRWNEVAESLAATRESERLLDLALADLVVLRVGGELFWNPKLETAPGCQALLSRLRLAGYRVQEPRSPRLAAEG